MSLAGCVHNADKIAMAVASPYARIGHNQCRDYLVGFTRESLSQNTRLDFTWMEIYAHAYTIGTGASE